MATGTITLDSEWAEVEKLLQDFAKELDDAKNKTFPEAVAASMDQEETPVVPAKPVEVKPIVSKTTTSAKERKCYSCGQGTRKLLSSSMVPICDGCLDDLEPND